VILPTELTLAQTTWIAVILAFIAGIAVTVVVLLLLLWKWTKD